MERKTCRLLLMCLFSCFALFLSAAAMAGPKGVVKVGLQYDPTTLNMLELKTGIDLSPILHMYQALQATETDTGERTFENSLTEWAKVMENGKDIRFKLRKGNLFHTGDPVTAHDVKFTYEQCANPQNANLMAGALDEIEKIEIIDDYNFIFRFYDPYAAWRELLWIGICSKKYFEKVGIEGFRKHPVGSGAFRFVSRKIGESVTLEANENFRWKENGVEKKVAFKTLKFITVSDDITRLAMLETGELDLVSSVLPHQVARLKRNKNIKVKKTDQVPSLFGLSVRPGAYPIMKDKKLKRAMNHAIDRQEIVDKIFLGEGYPMYMFASKSELGYDPGVKFEYDPEKARKLLKVSSYKPGTQLILSYTSAIPNEPLIAATLQKYLGDVGIKVKLQQLETGTAATYARNRDPRMGPLSLYSFAGGRDPSTRLLLTIVSSSIYCAYTNRPNKEEVDAWCLAQAREPNKEKRSAILKKIHQTWIDDPGSIVLFGLYQIYAMTDRIEYSWLPKEAFLFYLHRIEIVK